MQKAIRPLVIPPAEGGPAKSFKPTAPESFKHNLLI
jgi:hypothetical protein